MNQINKKSEFLEGLKRGFPIFLGYFPVSFTYGILAVQSGFPVWAAVLMSFTNVTSSGQFAATNLIFAGAGYFEICLTTFVINIRYFLMSLSLSQKLEKHTTIKSRLIFGYAVTDEIFAFASVCPKPVTSFYMYGLMSTPITGWVLGTLCGALASDLLPPSLQAAMGIALYAMFIAIIIPAARECRPVLFVIVIAIAVTCICKYVPLLSHISAGFRTIIATIISAGTIAYFFPQKETEGSHD